MLIQVSLHTLNNAHPSMLSCGTFSLISCMDLFAVGSSSDVSFITTTSGFGFVALSEVFFARLLFPDESLGVDSGTFFRFSGGAPFFFAAFEGSPFSNTENNSLSLKSVITHV